MPRFGFAQRNGRLQTVFAKMISLMVLGTLPQPSFAWDLFPDGIDGNNLPTVARRVSASISTASFSCPSAEKGLITIKTDLEFFDPPEGYRAGFAALEFNATWQGTYRSEHPYTPDPQNGTAVIEVTKDVFRWFCNSAVMTVSLPEVGVVRIPTNCGWRITSEMEKACGYDY